MAGLFFLGLLLAAAQPVAVEPLDGSRIRLTVIYNGANAEMHVRAQLRLMAEAERRCRSRGGSAAVSEGTLEANQVPGRRNRIALSEIYRCTPAVES